MKLRSDYEKSLWRRLVRFVDGETLADVEKRAEELRESMAEEQEENDTKAEEVFEATPEPESREERRRQLEEAHAKEASALMEKYKNWPKEHGIKIFGRLYALMAVILCSIIIVTLLATVSYLPEFGLASNPNNNEVVERYNAKGLEETGAVNAVAGMILDYRAFDTLGESHVLFIAAVCVMILLRLDHSKKDGKDLKQESEDNDRLYEPKDDRILQLTAKVLVPIIILFGIYVILNGHLSPGGGFSGGAIIGAGLILYVNAFGFQKASKIMNRKNYAVLSVVPLLFYAAAKGYSFFTGANHLESGIPKGTPGAILSAGLILPLNICVGLVVACTMYNFYTLFRKGGM